MGCGGPDWMECMGYVPVELVWVAFFGGFAFALFIVGAVILWVGRKADAQANQDGDAE